jgi:DNA-binding transcriptional ArsR family regulator
LPEKYPPPALLKSTPRSTSSRLSATRDAALADPTRRAILARLAQGEATVNELAEPFDMRLPAISKHLNV